MARKKARVKRTKAKRKVSDTLRSLRMKNAWKRRKKALEELKELDTKAGIPDGFGGASASTASPSSSSSDDFDRGYQTGLKLNRPGSIEDTKRELEYAQGYLHNLQTTQHQLRIDLLQARVRVDLLQAKIAAMSDGFPVHVPESGR